MESASAARTTGLVIACFVSALFICGPEATCSTKQFNLAFITIGWDYFQVLAFFSTIDVEWPTVVLDFFDVQVLQL